MKFRILSTNPAFRLIREDYFVDSLSYISLCTFVQDKLPVVNFDFTLEFDGVVLGNNTNFESLKFNETDFNYIFLNLNLDMTSSYEILITNIFTLSKLNIDQKFRVINGLVVLDEFGLYSKTRRFITRWSRFDNLVFLKDLVEAIKDRKTLFVKPVLCKNILRSLRSLICGLYNFCITYKSDTIFVNQIYELIKQLESTISAGNSYASVIAS